MVLRDFEEKEEEEENEEQQPTIPMETTPKRPKPLHNFSLPFLKWGTQRHLRCTNSAVGDYAGTSNSNDRRSSKSTNSNESTATRNHHQQPSGSNSKRQRVIIADDNEGIAVVREKLMHDLKTAADRMKDAILRDEQEDDDDAETLKSWKLRTRQKDNFKTPPVVIVDQVKRRDFSSPARIDGAAGVNVSSRLRRNVNSNKSERVKFSVQLSKKEVDEDFLSIVGHRPPRRPNKRPKVVQRQINCLLPGLWLTEVKPEMYKVLDTNENGKSAKRKGKGKCFDESSHSD